MPQQLKIEEWITPQQIARVRGVSDVTARRELKRAAHGKPSHGECPVVRIVRGRGGSSGKRYEALLSSYKPPFLAEWYRQQPGAALLREAHEDEEIVAQDSPCVLFAPQSSQEVWADYDRQPEGNKAKALERHEIYTFYESLATASLTQRQRIDIVRKKFGVSAGTVYEMRKRCKGADPGNWLPLLAPHHRGCQVHAEITPAAWDYFQSIYLTQQKRNIRSCLRETERVGKELGWMIPSYATIRRMVYELPLPLRVLMREGEKKFSERYPAHERLYADVKVHDIWCADARITDTLIVGQDGRPHRAVVVLIIDVRTRLIVGWAIGETESTELYLEALRNAIAKTNALPREFNCDNSRAAASKFLSGGSKSRFRFTVRPDEPLGVLPLLGINIIFALPRWARSKVIESLNRLFAEMDRATGKAYLGHRVGSRPEDHDPNAAWPVKRYVALMEQTIAEYHQRPHRGNAMDGKSPLTIYNELIADTPIRTPSEDQIALLLLVPERVKLDPKDNTVKVRGNRYWAARLGDLPLNSFVTARFDPRDLSKPLRIYRDEVFFCFAELHEKTGFRNTAAAKAHLRARRQWEKGVKQQARAIKDMGKAQVWHPGTSDNDTPDSIAAQAALSIFPTPKIAELVRPRQDLRGPKVEQTGISPSDIRDALTRRYNSQK